MQEYNTEGVLTFSKIFKYLKKALPVILVTMLVSVIIGVMVTALGNKSYKQYETQAVIELTYEGADKGLAPDGGLFDKANFISIEKIETVLNNLDLSSKFSASDIRNAFVITPRYSESIMNILNSTTNTDELMKLLEGIQPTSYSIKLYYTNINNLSKENSLDIVKGVIDENVKTVSDAVYKKFELPGGIADSSYLNSYTHLEYVTVMGDYLSSYKNTIKLMNNSEAFTSVFAKLEYLESQNNILNDYIVSNGLLTVEDKTRTTVNLKKTIKALEEREALIISNIKNVSDTIAMLVPKFDSAPTVNQGTSGVIILPDYTEVLKPLTATLDNLYKEQLIVTQQKKKTEAQHDKIDAITPIDTIGADELAKIESLKNELHEGIKYISSDLQNQAENIAMVYGVKTTLAPVNLVSVESSSKSMFINVVISLLVGFVAGLVIYAIIEKYVLKRRQQLAVSDNTSTLEIKEIAQEEEQKEVNNEATINNKE